MKTMESRLHRARSRSYTVLVLVLFASTTNWARAQGHDDHALGRVDFPVSCSEQARNEFNRATALLHHMTYPEARVAFQQVAKIDPQCAMAHWGVAMTLFQPLWPTRPGPAEIRRGQEAVQNARALNPPTERERLFVDAGAAFFEDAGSPSYWQRIGRWEKAMETVYAKFPQDPEAAAFYALAHLATAPSNKISRDHSDRAAGILLAIYRKNSTHPGAMHYLVHANDVPGRERESLDIVREYERVAPNNPHALHMPTHIHTRLGNWEAVIRGNLRAAEAALKFPAGDEGQFVWDEFPHAIEYLVYAHLQMGADDKAQEQLGRLQRTARLEPSFKTAFHLSSTQARYALERRAWSEAMSLPVREPPTLAWDRFKWPEAVTWFARGLGAARHNNADEARLAINRLEVLEAAAGKTGEELFTRNIRVLRLSVVAWLAHLEQNYDTSVSVLREAADLEMSTPKHAVTPAPTLPACEQLGDLFLEQARPAEALEAYRCSLDLYPRRFNSLLGAARAARALQNDSIARAYYLQLLAMAESGTRAAALQEARAFAPR